MNILNIMTEVYYYCIIIKLCFNIIYNHFINAAQNILIRFIKNLNTCQSEYLIYIESKLYADNKF